MKKFLFSIPALMASGWILAQAMGNNQYSNEAYGNYNYNNAYNQRNLNNPTTYSSNLNDDEIVVAVNGLMNLTADNYVAIFNIVQIGETAETTDAQMNIRISNFKSKLKMAGIDTNDIKTDMISFVPKYEFQQENKVFSRHYNEIPAGFELQKNVAVRFKNSAKLDDIVSAAAYAEIYDLVKVDYFIPNLQKSLDSLRFKCIMELKSKVKMYDMIGIKLDTMKKTMKDNFLTSYPPSRYKSYQAFSRPSLQAAKRKSPPVVNEIQKPVSKYYSQVDYDYYDLVINPVISEPVVQISYSISVKYFLTEKETPKNNYIILTPNGETKQLTLK